MFSNIQEACISLKYIFTNYYYVRWIYIYQYYLPRACEACESRKQAETLFESRIKRYSFIRSCSACLVCHGCSICPVLAVLFRYFCPDRPALAFLPCLTQSAYSVCLLFCLSSSACPVFCLPCSVSSVLPIPFYPSRSAYPVLLSHSACHSACPVLPVPSAFQFCWFLSACRVLPVLFCLSCSACPALPILSCSSFCLSCSTCPVLPVLFYLS